MRKILAYGLLAVLVAAACVKTPSGEDASSQEIFFCVRSPYSLQVDTKSRLNFSNTDFSALSDSAIGLSAVYLPDGVNYPGTDLIFPAPYFLNRPIRHDMDNSASIGSTLAENDPLRVGLDSRAWAAQPGVIWPYSGQLSFFAYAPYREEMNTGAPLVVSERGVYFRPEEDPKEQVDLVAGVTLDQTRNSLATFYSSREFVDLTLYHCLTWVDFQARVRIDTENFADKAALDTWYHANGLDNCKIGVAGVKLSGILASNNATWTTTGLVWGEPPVSRDTTSYELSMEEGTLLSVADGYLIYDENNLGSLHSYQDITVGHRGGETTEGYLYLLPHTLLSGATRATLTVDYGIYTPTGENDSFEPRLMYQKVFNISELADSKNVWEAGKRVIYQMTLDITKASNCTVEAHVEDWTDAGNNYNNDGKTHDYLE